MEILHKVHNVLLSRTELQIDLPYQVTTPSVADVRKQIADKMKVGEDVVVVNKIGNRFGHKHAVVTACIYDSKEMHDKIEPKPKVKKEAAAAK